MLAATRLFLEPWAHNGKSENYNTGIQTVQQQIVWSSEGGHRSPLTPLSTPSEFRMIMAACSLSTSECAHYKISTVAFALQSRLGACTCVQWLSKSHAGHRGWVTTSGHWRIQCGLQGSPLRLWLDTLRLHWRKQLSNSVKQVQQR